MAEYKVIGDVAVIALSNPPVNSLGKRTRREICECLDKANADAKVSGIVICGKEKTFSAGADITEFGTPDPKAFPQLIDIIEKLESSTKPIVAAIHGFAFGGGLELALGCHYRIAHVSARFGFPEVKLGLLPGAGGTQRLPRVIPINQALKWIVYGKENPAKDCFSIGLLDALFKDKSNLVNEAIAFLESKKRENLNTRRISLLPVKQEDEPGAVAKISKALAEKYRGGAAPNICYHTVVFGCSLPYSQGMLHEQKGFELLINSVQSKALIHSFFAERVCSKWRMPGMSYTGVKPLEIKSFAVIGLGTMGRGIVLSLLRKGLPVFVFEDTAIALQNGVDYINNQLERMAQKKLLTSVQSQYLKTCVKPTSSYSDISDVDLVVECVFESMDLKKKIFSKLDSVCKPSAILASNTSSLDINALAGVTSRPQKVVGMHFFAPAHLMPLLENIYGDKTSPVVVATAMSVGKDIGKTPVLVGNCEGFVGNRMYAFYTCESDYLLEEGAYPEEVDHVLRLYGFAMGRYQVADLSGNDIGYRIRQGHGITAKQQPSGSPENLRNGKRYCPLSDYLVESGRHGHKTGLKGWFDYKMPELKPIPSPLVNKMIDNYRERIGIVPRKIYPQEIIERMLYPMINEGFNILGEGIATRPSDIDVIWLNGYAWPRHTGGPMFYAHTVGLPHVLEVIKKYWDKSDFTEAHWKPSRMLVHLVEYYSNPHINDWMKLTETERSMWRSSL